jgi:hypothetical protein
MSRRDEEETRKMTEETSQKMIVAGNSKRYSEGKELKALDELPERQSVMTLTWTIAQCSHEMLVQSLEISKCFTECKQ